MSTGGVNACFVVLYIVQCYTVFLVIFVDSHVCIVRSDYSLTATPQHGGAYMPSSGYPLGLDNEGKRRGKSDDDDYYSIGYYAKKTQLGLLGQEVDVSELQNTGIKAF